MKKGGSLQDARHAVYELANCSVRNFSSLTRFSGLQDFPSWRTRSASSEKKTRTEEKVTERQFHTQLAMAERSFLRYSLCTIAST